MGAKMFIKYVPNFCPDTLSCNWDFLDPLELDANSLNGLSFCNIYIPEEVLTDIFSYLSPKDVIKCALVCKQWHNIAKSNILWQRMYSRKMRCKKVKNLPWYIFYLYLGTDNFDNLIKNGNGEEGLTHWTVEDNLGDGFVVEDPPVGCDPLPANVPEFHGQRSCFATYAVHSCTKYQKFDFRKKRLMQYVIKKYKPTLYASEWVLSRFNLRLVYELGLFFEAHNITFQYRPFPVIRRRGKWHKVEIVYNDYPDDLTAMSFYHKGSFRHYYKEGDAPKMAGGVLKFIFDSIEPLEEEEKGGDGDPETVV